MFMARDVGHHTVLSSAVGHGSSKTFHAVFTAARERLTVTEVRKIPLPTFHVASRVCRMLFNQANHNQATARGEDSFFVALVG